MDDRSARARTMEKHEDDVSLLMQCEAERAAFADALSFVDRELASFAATDPTALPSLSLFDDEPMGHQFVHGHDPPPELHLFRLDGDDHASIDLLALESLTAADVAAGLASGGDSDVSVLQLTSDTCISPSPSTGEQQQEQQESPATAGARASGSKNRSSQPAPKRRQRAKKAATPTSGGASASTAMTPTGAAARPTKKPLNYNPNKARDERREELIYLRKKVVELETQLDGMQQKRPRLMASTSGAPGSGILVATSSSSSTARAATVSRNSESPTSSSSSDAAALSLEQQQQLVLAGMWQDIATRQCEGRIKAERENIRLKIVLENQLKIAKSLEKLLKKKMAAREVEHCPQCQQLHRVYPPTRDPRTDAQIYDDLTAGVAQSYDDVDSVFAANGLATMEVPHSDARIRTASDDDDSVVLEILANKLLPFDVHATATAAWHYFSYAKQRTPYRSYFFDAPKTTDTTDDTITENFSLGLHANSTSAHFRVKQVLRRFVEDERVVIVWRSFVEPVEFSDEPLSDLRFEERGYIVIKKPQSLAGAGTLVQTCYIFTPNVTGDSNGSHALHGHRHPKVGAITDFVLSATAANITASHQMIENVLMEQAMRGKSIASGNVHHDAAVLECVKASNDSE